jgi:WD40 repeat protein
LGATTTFSAGHSYLSSSFSTATTIYDVKRAKALHNVEEFAITRNGMPYQAVDVNVWGVTFKRDGDGFYATMASKGTIHLVEGSVRSRTLRTLKEGVECPSLSPNGKRVAYKMRDDSPGFSGWRVHVLDLETGSDYALPGDRSVDDQVEWLDDGHVLYGLIRQVGYLESDVWMAPADASSAPKVLIREAWSPAVVRDPAP